MKRMIMEGGFNTMKTFKTFASIVGAASLIVAASLPVAAGTIANGDAQPIEADVQPTQHEVQLELSAIGHRLHITEKASESNPAAERDFVSAQRSFGEGYYENAQAQALSADAAIAPAPNWLDRSNSVSR
jgi:hypothetical protein